PSRQLHRISRHAIMHKPLNHWRLAPSPWRAHYAPRGYTPRSPPLPHHFPSLIARRFGLAAREANLNNQPPGPKLQIPANWPLLQIPAQSPLLKAQLWAQVLPHITVHPDLAIATGEQTAWAVRKNNTHLKQLLDGFITPRAVGTTFGDTLLRRYMESDIWIKNATSPDEMKKFSALSGWFKEYAGQYDFDYLMIMAV